jgi:hypothetical protein
MIDLTGRQSEETKLRESLEDLKETIKSTYQRKVHERVQGGVAGAGHFGSSFFNTLGLTGLADSFKKKAEAKEIDRQGKEAFVQKFQEGNDTFTGSTARGIAETQYDQNKQNPAAEEAALEQKEQQSNALEIQQKSGEDLTALYTISDDYFKAQIKHNEEVMKLFEKIAENGAGGGGGSLLGSAAELAGDLAGSKKGGAAGKAGKLASLASGAGKFAKVGGGLLAVGTAAYEGYSDYQAADEKVKSGEISQKEGQVEKGKAVGGGVGGAGGALAGAAAGAALGSVVPVVGTAIGGLIGGAVGYWGGKKAGQAVGGAGVQGYQALTADGTPAAPAAPAAAATSAEVQRGRPTMANDPRLVSSQPSEPSPLVRKSSLAAAGAAAVMATAPMAAAQPAPPTEVQGRVASVDAGINRLTGKPIEPAVSKPDSEQSALTGFTRDYLERAADPNRVGRFIISPEQAKNYLSQMEPGQMEFKKSSMRGKPVLESSPIQAAPLSPSSGSAISSGSTEISAAKEASSSAGATVNSVNAPVSNTVVNNSTQLTPKSSKNEDTTFQKYIDRRYYP